jgi:hypothetical protein
MTYVSSKWTKSKKLPTKFAPSMTSSVRHRTNIARHKDQILNVINKLSEEELEQVSEMLKQSEAGEDPLNDDLEDEYAAAVMRDAEEMKTEDEEASQVPYSAVASSAVAISNL